MKAADLREGIRGMAGRTVPSKIAVVAGDLLVEVQVIGQVVIRSSVGHNGQIAA